MKLSLSIITAALALVCGPDLASASRAKSKAVKSTVRSKGTKSTKDARQCKGVAGPTMPTSVVYTMSNLDANCVLAFSRDIKTGSLTYLATVATGGGGRRHLGRHAAGHRPLR